MNTVMMQKQPDTPSKEKKQLEESVSYIALSAHIKGLIKSWCACIECDEETTQQIISHGLGIYWLIVQQQDKSTKETEKG